MTKHTMPKPWRADFHEGAGGIRYARILSPTGYILLSMIPVQGLDEEYLKEMLRATNNFDGLVAALEAVEWEDEGGYCPSCKGCRWETPIPGTDKLLPHGHDLDCQLAAALAKAKEKAPA